jgi:hypothetical protein
LGSLNHLLNGIEKWQEENNPPTPSTLFHTASTTGQEIEQAIQLLKELLNSGDYSALIALEQLRKLLPSTQRQEIATISSQIHRYEYQLALKTLNHWSNNYNLHSEEKG